MGRCRSASASYCLPTHFSLLAYLLPPSVLLLLQLDNVIYDELTEFFNQVGGSSNNTA